MKILKFDYVFFFFWFLADACIFFLALSSIVLMQPPKLMAQLLFVSLGGLFVGIEMVYDTINTDKWLDDVLNKEEYG